MPKPKSKIKKEVKEKLKESIATSPEISVPFEEMPTNSDAFIETKKGIDLIKDGKYPWGLMLIHDKEAIIDMVVELKDGTCQQFGLNVSRVEGDYFGNYFKKFGESNRYASVAIPGIFKKIITCTAKKIYIIY